MKASIVFNFRLCSTFEETRIAKVHPSQSEIKQVELIILNMNLKMKRRLVQLICYHLIVWTFGFLTCHFVVFSPHINLRILRNGRDIQVISIVNSTHNTHSHNKGLNDF